MDWLVDDLLRLRPPPRPLPLPPLPRDTDLDGLVGVIGDWEGDLRPLCLLADMLFATGVLFSIEMRKKYVTFQSIYLLNAFPLQKGLILQG